MNQFDTIFSGRCEKAETNLVPATEREQAQQREIYLIINGLADRATAWTRTPTCTDYVRAWEKQR